MRRGFLWMTALALVTVLLSQALGQFWAQSAPVVSSTVAEKAGPLILDAGHGGEDGGAVSVTGYPESQINLAIVLKMDDILGLYGTAPILLRSEDISLNDDGLATMRERKTSDLKNRVKAVQAVEGGTLVSIHQNSFTDGRYHGSQVFYSSTDGSRELAQHIQEAIRASVQPDNSREIKKIPDTVYLMNHIDCTAVLVECGFLTNGAEETRLRDQDYQRKLAAVISAAWLTFGTAEGQNELGPMA